MYDTGTLWSFFIKYCVTEEKNINVLAIICAESDDLSEMWLGISVSIYIYNFVSRLFLYVRTFYTAVCSVREIFV